MKSSPGEGRAPCSSTGWGAALLLREEEHGDPDGLGGQQAERERAACLMHDSIQGSSHRSTASRVRRVIVTLSSALRRAHLDTVSSFLTKLSPSSPITLAANTGKQWKEMSEEWEEDFYCHSFSGVNSMEGDRYYCQVVPIVKKWLRQRSGTLPAVSPALPCILLRLLTVSTQV